MLNSEQISPDETADLLPPAFADWFAGRGWALRAHQKALIEKAQEGRSVLLTAPTGAGKTLAGFLPTLIEAAEREKPFKGLHTLYLSPLKALAVDISRNLMQPVDELGLDISIETRTGDTPSHKKQRQRRTPPNILLTTPEQVALLLSHAEAPKLFGALRAIVIDELHALENTKRGDMLALCLARLGQLAPEARRVGLSATVSDPERLRKYLVSQPGAADLVTAEEPVKPQVEIVASSERVPWSGHSAAYAMDDVMAAIRGVRSALVFVNTRSQAEATFQHLWARNDESLEIALHHGSLSVEQRRRVEAAMAAGRLRAVVCTSTLELGIDWGAVDLVIQIGAPKGSSRMLQRIGRSNHRLDEPSRALLVPANRFEVLECEAAAEAIEEGLRDGDAVRPGTLDVLAQYVLGRACGAPFTMEQLYGEVTAASPYEDLCYENFERVVDFVATGGYALRRYEERQKLRRQEDGSFKVASPKVARQYRMNAGTIVEAPMIRVRRLARSRKKAASSVGNRPVGRPGAPIGEIEEWFIDQLRPGDTFLFAGEVWRYEGLSEKEAYATRAQEKEPMIPAYQGGKFPLSTFLAARVRQLLADSKQWRRLPRQVSNWLTMQQDISLIPGPQQMLIETFPRGGKFYMVCYPFEGRLAHQSLGMLLTQRLEGAGYQPLGFTASDYALAIWGLRDMAGADMAMLFAEDASEEVLEGWLADSSLFKRSFRNCAIIGGLINRRHPGQEKTGRQVTFSADLIYDVLRRYEPDHILLRAARDDVASGLIDLARLRQLVRRLGAPGRLVISNLDRVSPLSVPVMLDIGRESVPGSADEALLAEAADELIAEAQA